MKSKILFYGLLFLICLAYSSISGKLDFDLWARLIAGLGVFQTGSVLKSDFLSYTPTHKWFDHEWGSGVIFYAMQQSFGAVGLLVLQALLVFLTFVLIVKLVKLYYPKLSPYNLIFYLMSVVAFLVTTGNPIRCHLFSFLFFTLFWYVLELAKRGNIKLLISLPVLTVIWNNLHGGVVSGLGLILIYMVGEALNKHQFKHYGYTLLVSSILLVVNPYGIEYLKFLFNANTMHRTYISEWWSSFSPFHLKRFLLYKLFLVVGLVLEFLKFKNKENIDKTRFLIVLTTTVLSIQHVKMIPFFIIAFVCCEYDKFNFLNLCHARVKKIAYSFLFIFSGFVVSLIPLKSYVDFKVYPVKEVEFIKVNNIKGNLFTNFGLGSYVSYKLYPQNKIFMDGRYEEVYYDYMIPMMKKFFMHEQGWDELLVKYSPDVILIENYYPVYNVLAQNKDWALIYIGDTFGVFVKKEMAKSKYIQPSKDLEYYKKNLFKTDIDLKNKK